MEKFKKNVNLRLGSLGFSNIAAVYRVLVRGKKNCGM